MLWENWLSDTAKGANASDIRELLKITARPEMISFAGGLPDPALFPIEEYRAANERVMARYGARALQYSPTEGIGELRETLVERLAGEGIECEQGRENVLLTTGSQQALELLGQVFINPGDTILIEAPSYVGALQAFSPRQPRFEAVAMDEDGLRIDLLEERLTHLAKQGQRPKFLYTVPTFQNPTGVTLSLARRQALLSLAEQENLVIIEDDPYGQLRFEGQHLPGLKSLDRSGRVISLRTFSKTLAPALRTGYVVGPGTVLGRLTILKQAADLCSSALNQFLVYEMLESGAMERYVQKVVEVYRVKAKTMAATLKTHLGEYPVSWNEPQGGMFMWLQLPDELDAGVLSAQAIEAGVAYVKGAAFYPPEFADQGRHSLRLNFSHPSPAQIESGLTRLAGVLTANLPVPLPA